jgi:mRNA-degrading endonuclease RelE of RelBE toxin-antitoxin system
MSFRLEWKPRALKDAEKLDRKARERVLVALERLAGTGYGDVVRLTTSSPRCTTRARKWRLFSQL